MALPVALALLSWEWCQDTFKEGQHSQLWLYLLPVSPLSHKVMHPCTICCIVMCNVVMRESVAYPLGNVFTCLSRSYTGVTACVLFPFTLEAILVMCTVCIWCMVIPQCLFTCLVRVCSHPVSHVCSGPILCLMYAVVPSCVIVLNAAMESPFLFHALRNTTTLHVVSVNR